MPNERDNAIVPFELLNLDVNKENMICESLHNLSFTIRKNTQNIHYEYQNIVLYHKRRLQ